MKRRMEILAGISLFTAASIGATACTVHLKRHPASFCKRDTLYKFTSRMAKSILILAGKHNAIDSKPPYSLYFTEQLLTEVI